MLYNMISSVSSWVTSWWDVSPEAFLDAAKKGKLRTIRDYIAADRENHPINFTDKNHQTALMHAAKHGCFAVILKLSTVPGIKLNSVDKKGNTALHIATSQGRTRITNALLALPNTDANILNNDGYTPLMLAIMNNQLDIVRTLTISNTVDITLQNSSGYNALMCAAFCGNEIITSILLKKLKQQDPNKINDHNYNKETVLMCAALYGHIGVVAILVAAPNINLKLKNKQGLTAQQIAEQNGHKEIAKLLHKISSLEIKAKKNHINATQRLFVTPHTPPPNVPQSTSTHAELVEQSSYRVSP